MADYFHNSKIVLRNCPGIFLELLYHGKNRMLYILPYTYMDCFEYTIQIDILRLHR